MNIYVGNLPRSTSEEEVRGLFAEFGTVTDVKLIKDHPLFHKIKERHNSKEMIEEIAKELGNLVKENYSKIIPRKIKLNNFIKEIDEVLGK